MWQCLYRASESLSTLKRILGILLDSRICLKVLLLWPAVMKAALPKVWISIRYVLSVVESKS